jgi:hypothetical protein
MLLMAVIVIATVGIHFGIAGAYAKGKPTESMTIPQMDDGSVCWSAITDMVWHMEDGKLVVDSQRVIGSGRILLPPGASEAEKKFRIDLMTDLAFALDSQSAIGMSMERDRRVCWNCGGAGLRGYLGEWDFGLHWCLICEGDTCNVRCKPSSGHTCPPAC